MGHPGQELGVDCQPTVETVSWLGNQAHSKLMLKHDDCCPESRSMRQKLEGEWRGDLVGNIGNADVKVRKALLHNIPLYNLQMHSIFRISPLGGQAKCKMM